MSREVDVYGGPLDSADVLYLEERGRQDLISINERLFDESYSPQLKVNMPAPAGLEPGLAGGSIIPADQAFGAVPEGAWPDGDDDDEGDEEEPSYSAWKKADLENEIARRNAERSEEDHIIPGSNKNRDLIFALEADDEDNS